MLTQNLHNELHHGVTYLQHKSVKNSKTPLCFQRSLSHWAWNTINSKMHWVAVSGSVYPIQLQLLHSCQEKNLLLCIRNLWELCSHTLAVCCCLWREFSLDVSNSVFLKISNPLIFYSDDEHIAKLYQFLSCIIFLL